MANMSFRAAIPRRARLPHHKSVLAKAASQLARQRNTAESRCAEWATEPKRCPLYPKHKPFWHCSTLLCHWGEAVLLCTLPKMLTVVLVGISLLISAGFKGYDHSFPSGPASLQRASQGLPLCPEKRYLENCFLLSMWPTQILFVFLRNKLLDLRSLPAGAALHPGSQDRTCACAGGRHQTPTTLQCLLLLKYLCCAFAQCHCFTSFIKKSQTSAANMKALQQT